MVRLRKGFDIKTIPIKDNLLVSKQLNWMDNPSKPRFVLVAMPINHFGEKVRWCLEISKIPFKEKTVGGILSAIFRGRSVPWLLDEDACSLIGNSDEIFSYVGALAIPALEEISFQMEKEKDTDDFQNQDNFQNEKCIEIKQKIDKMKHLFLRTPETMEWEKDLNEFGHAIQGWAYYYHLRSCNIFPLLAWGAYESEHVSFMERWLIYLLYPIILIIIGDAFKLLNKDIRNKRYEIIRKMMDKVDDMLEKNQMKLKEASKRESKKVNHQEDVFLMGNHISYIDITFCSLAAPLLSFSIIVAPSSSSESLYAGGRFKSFVLNKYRENGLKKTSPRECLELEQELLNRPCGKYILKMYEKYRKTPL